MMQRYVVGGLVVLSLLLGVVAYRPIIRAFYGGEPGWPLSSGTESPGPMLAGMPEEIRPREPSGVRVVDQFRRELAQAVIADEAGGALSDARTALAQTKFLKARVTGARPALDSYMRGGPDAHYYSEAYFELTRKQGTGSLEVLESYLELISDGTALEKATPAQLWEVVRAGKRRVERTREQTAELQAKLRVLETLARQHRGEKAAVFREEDSAAEEPAAPEAGGFHIAYVSGPAERPGSRTKPAAQAPPVEPGPRAPSRWTSYAQERLTRYTGGR